MGRRKRRLLKNSKCEKKCYVTEQLAKNALFSMQRRGCVRLHTYKCDQHKVEYGKLVFHIGHRPSSGTKK